MSYHLGLGRACYINFETWMVWRGLRFENKIFKKKPSSSEEGFGVSFIVSGRWRPIFSEALR